MIQEQVEEIFVERSILVKQQNIARRNYKIVNWLKLLSLHEQNHDLSAQNQIINEIHQNFIMQEGFWLTQARKRLPSAPNRDNIELLLLALEDGHYLQVASLISETALKSLKEKTLRETFVLSVLEKCISLFEHSSHSGKFFKMIREVYSLTKNTPKIRSAFEREMKLSHDNFDLVWDEYKSWQTDKASLEKNEKLYGQAKQNWEQQAQEFDDNLCSDLNIKQSLINLQSVNESTIDQKKYLMWLDKLSSEQDKMWFLRRVFLNYRQMAKPYLFKVESLYRQDEEKIIKKYQVAIRLSNHSKEIEMKYLRFLGRRIAKHLLNESLPDSYNLTWATNVGFFREQIANLIEKPRPGTPPEEVSAIFKDYYRLWIEVEEKIVRDKETVCKLYESFIKQTSQLVCFEDYAKSLMFLGSVKDARNVLKRYTHHASDDRSRQQYLKFIELYGDVQDQISFYRETGDHFQPVQTKITQNQHLENKSVNNNRPTPIEEDKIVEQKSQIQEENSLKRERPIHDETNDKIYESMRKKLHMDGEFTIFIKGIPLEWSESDVLNILAQPQEVVRVSMVVKNSQHKDYCYVQYKNKEAAEYQVQHNTTEMKMYISKPPSEYDQSSTLFLCALPPSVNESKISSLFADSNKIKEIRLKLDRQKNYAYVQFYSSEEKEEAFKKAKESSLVIDGKKIIIQYCDSSRAKNKKFTPVVFLKNLPFKAKTEDIQKFFEGKQIANIHIPLSRDKGKPQGFAYVEFAKFKDYQEALDKRSGNLFGRQFQILRSDRQITDHSEDHRPRTHQSVQNQHHQRRERGGKRHKENNQHKESTTKDNNFFSNLFK